MPYNPDESLEDEDFFVQSDLLNSVEPGLASYRAASESLGEGKGSPGPTVVKIDDDVGADAAGMDDDEDIPVNAPSSAPKKRGRPSGSASGAPAKSVASKTPAKTPRSAKSAAAPKSTGRKRKAADVDPESEPEAQPTPAKRGRPARAAGAAASARLAAKAAKKRAPGRPKSSAITEKPKGQASRPKKNGSNGAVPAGEYEVEKILESSIDNDLKEHLYLVKWKNYPASDNTWEPKRNLAGAQELVRDFDAKKEKAPKKEAPKAKVEKGRPGRKRKAKA